MEREREGGGLAGVNRSTTGMYGMHEWLHQAKRDVGLGSIRWRNGMRKAHNREGEKNVFDCLDCLTARPGDGYLYDRNMYATNHCE